MHIKFIEIQNFRKLKAIRIDFADTTTVFVGANNSGKTSAMVALGHFLIDQRRFTINDFTLSNLSRINRIGTDWESSSTQSSAQNPTLAEWQSVLPSIDVWLQVADNEIHYVSHLLPSLDWTGGMLGVRLRLEPEDVADIQKEFIAATTTANETKKAAERANKDVAYTLALWPRSLADFLERRLKHAFHVQAYLLDPSKCVPPVKGIASPQLLPEGSEAIEGDPFKGLMQIDEINAQRGFADAGSKRIDSEGQETHDKRRLTEQLRSYYEKHLDPSDLPEPSDLDALQAIDKAQSLFDERLKIGFAAALVEVEGLGYPGITDPKLTISTRIRPTDGLNHPAAVQYEVSSITGATSEITLRLPEDYNGLGYQNLISIVFRLMSFRDAWMQVGKAEKRAAVGTGGAFLLPPLHLVLVEEPEAHLHAQVQQVFIRKAYDILRAHADLGKAINLATQLVVSTHSSHVAHECKFESLRYFRRLPAVHDGDVPTSTVVNLSEVFGKDDDTERFVTRYLKATHCDLFFADAAILVEGPAERMLVPHFIEAHYAELRQRYLTILEIGGSHAHRLRPLIEHLGLTSLVVTDLDPAEPTGNHPAVQAAKGAGQITRNMTLKTWLPKKSFVDELLSATDAEKAMRDDLFFSIRVAYQCPVQVILNDDGVSQEALANTFEDSLVLENVAAFGNMKGDGLVSKFKEAVGQHKNASALNAAMFGILKTGNKAEFALDLLYQQEPQSLRVPTYIREGLTWLQDQLNRKQLEVVPLVQPSAALGGAQ